MYRTVFIVVSMALSVLANPADPVPKGKAAAPPGKLAPFGFNNAPEPPTPANEPVPAMTIAPFQAEPGAPNKGPSLEVRPDGTEVLKDPRNPLIDYIAKSPVGTQVATPLGKLNDARGPGGISFIPAVKGVEPVPIVPKVTAPKDPIATLPKLGKTPKPVRAARFR